MSLTIHPKDIVEASDSPLLAAADRWERFPLGEVASVLNGYAFASSLFSRTEGVPLIRIRDISSGTTTERYKGPFDDRYLIYAGDLLVGMDGDFNLARWTGSPALLNQRVMKIEPKEEVLDIDFLTQLLPGYLMAIHSLTSSTTVKHLSSRDVERLPIPVPTIDEQRTLASQIAALDGLLKSSQGRLTTVPTLLKKFRQSVLTAACSGQLTADWRGTEDLVGWVDDEAQNACERVQSGSTPREGFVTTPGIPFLKVYNIVEQKLNFDYKPQFVSDDVASSKSMTRSTTLPGDVLMNIVGPPLGKVAVVTEQYAEWTFNQALTLFRPSAHVSTQWLYIVLCSGIPFQDILMHTRGSAGQSNISLTQCREMVLPIPPMGEQDEIVRRVESFFTLADSIESRLAEATNHVGRISQAILAKAFRGELEVDFSSLPKSTRGVDSIERPEMPKLNPDHPITPTKMKTSLKEIVLTSEQTSFDPADLRALFSGDYNSYRDQLFALLNESSPVLKQKFDEASLRIQLVKE